MMKLALPALSAGPFAVSDAREFLLTKGDGNKPVDTGMYFLGRS
jgi:hypothetical protein